VGGVALRWWILRKQEERGTVENERGTDGLKLLPALKINSAGFDGISRAK